MAVINLKLKIKIIEVYKTQADFADVIDTREDLVSRVVRGRRSIPKDDLFKWSKALGVDVETLIEKGNC